MEYRIGLIHGDGIGPEIVKEAKKVLDAVCEKYGHKFEYTNLLLGGASIDVHGVPLTDETIEEAKIGRSDGNTDQRVDMAFRLGVAQHYGVACDHARLFHTADALAHSRACQRYLAGDILYRHAAIGRQQAQYFAVQFIHAGQASNGKILMF